MNSPDRFELRCVASVEGRPSRDLVLKCRADTPALELFRATADFLDIDDPWVVRAEGDVSLDDADDVISHLGLAQGDELRFVQRNGPPQGGEPPQNLETIVVVDGRTAGRRFALRDGMSIGRSADCDVVIADPSLSSKHFQLTVDNDRAITVIDEGSRNGTAVEGVLVLASGVSLEPGAHIRAGRTVFRRGFAKEVGRRAPGPDGFVEFNRPPRIATPEVASSQRIHAPPEEASKSLIPIAATVAPVVVGLAIWAITGSAMSLAFIALSPLIAIWTYIEDRRHGTRNWKTQSAKYRAEVDALATDLATARGDESERRRAAAPDIPALEMRALTIDQALWERRPHDPDWLSLRLGVRDQRSHLAVEFADGGSEALRDEALETIASGVTLPLLPVTMPLGTLGSVGLVGERADVEAVARSFVVQAATLHSPAELAIVAAVSDQAWDWLKWLPHVWVTGAEPTLAADRDRADTMIEALTAEYARRRAERRDRFAEHQPGSGILLLLDERLELSRAKVGELISLCTDPGISVIWLGSESRHLPGGCRGIVEIATDRFAVSLLDSKTGELLDDVVGDGVEDEVARRVARALACVKDSGARAVASAIPRSITLDEVAGLAGDLGVAITRQWSEPYLIPATPIGSKGDAAFTVDLRRDGPHALIAGTTGAGKSELLQTLTASLALGHRPDRLNFLLIDYKGGAAFKDCVDFPHTVGFVTDLDEQLSRRALVSLNAELRRREQLLRDLGAKDLRDAECIDGAATPPGLVILIDEFATLVKEVPAFVDGIVDVAQRGRSLGVHLVLATQRPAGAVNQNIRANTNLRIALRVSDSAESDDVINVPDAARITRDTPGRAFARVGHGELVEFQAAYVGGISLHADRTIEIERFTPLAAGVAKQQAAADDRPTDLRRMVEAARSAAGELAIPTQRSPWLPPLAELVGLKQLESPGHETAGRTVVFALEDIPNAQRQDTFQLDFEKDGGLLVFGAAGSGKTTLLRTIAASLALTSSPDEVHLYGLDFSNGALRSIAELPHCGDVVGGEDGERVERLLHRLAATISERRRGGSSEWAPDRPRVVVLLDDYGGFVSAFEGHQMGVLVEMFDRLVADGRALGVNFVVTCDRRGVIPNALANLFPLRLVLNLSDEDEFVAAGVDFRLARGLSLPAGRALSGAGTEIQIAVVSENPTTTGQADALRAWSSMSRTTTSAARVSRLPTSVDLQPTAIAGVAPIGVGGPEVEPIAIRLDDGHFSIIGPRRSGRTAALARVVESMNAWPAAKLSFHLIAPKVGPLTSLDIWSTAFRGFEECVAGVETLADSLRARGSRAGQLDVVVIDDADALAEELSAECLEPLVDRGEMTGCVFLASFERQAARRIYGGWASAMRKTEHGLLLTPDLEVDGDLLGVRLPRQLLVDMVPGRGFLTRRGNVELVQVARPSRGFLEFADTAP